MPVREDQKSDSLNPADKNYDDLVSRGLKELEDHANTGKPSQSSIDRGTADAEQYADTTSNGKSLYKGNGGKKDTKTETTKDENTFQRARSRFQALKGRAAGLAKNKWIIGGAIGGGGFVGLILIMLIIAASLKVPGLASNIAEYQFARMTQKIAHQNNRLLGFKISYDAASEADKGRIAAKYASVTGKVQEQWSKFDRYRPQVVMRNMHTTGQVSMNYDGTRLTSITLNGRETAVPRTTLISSKGRSLIPGYSFVQNARFSADLTNEFKSAMRTNDVGFITRGRVAADLRKQLGIGLVAWKVGEYKGLAKDEARRKFERRSNEVTKSNGGSEPTVSDSKEKVNQVKEAAAGAIADDDKLDKAIANGGVADDVQASLREVGNTSTLTTTLGVLNSTYAIATPICIVYDGSMSKGGPSVNAKSESQMKAYQFLATAAAQQKDGSDADAEAIGAFNDKLGNINNTPPVQRAAGKEPTILGSQPAQAGPAGSFTMFNAIFGGDSGVADSANSFADKVCPGLTNVYVAGGVAIANLATLGFGTAATTTAGKAANTVVGKIAQRVAANLTKESLKNTASKSGRLLYETGRSAVRIAGVTLLARMAVADSAGLYYDGLEQEQDYVEMADSGGNIMANELSRRQQFGRPLTQTEVAQSSADTTRYIAENNQQKSLFERYASINNPNSMLSRMSMSVSEAQVGSIVQRALNPSNALAAIASAITPKAHAATGDASENYYNVQFGWSREELAILDSDPTYNVMENELILHESGQEAEIEATYGKCFGLGNEDESSIGMLLQNENIVRDENGNVVDSGQDSAVCSPQKLGPGNEMVFRWRVARDARQALDDQLNIQLVEEATPEGAAAPTPSTGGGGTGNWVWPFSKDVWNGPFGYNVWGSDRVRSRHAGIDIGGTGGKAAVAIHDGVVSATANAGACKTYVTVKATGTPFWYTYQHLSGTSLKVGDAVVGGQTEIGRVFNGSSGRCIQGAHLHLSIERTAKYSAYSDLARVGCNPIGDAACARRMPSVPPLCLLEKEGRNYGSSVREDEIKGSAYCTEVLR